jgi:O-acetylhomoserine (thiol)-lyase
MTLTMGNLMTLTTAWLGLDDNLFQTERMMEMKFDTKAIHAGYSPDPATHSRAVPIYMTSAYAFDSIEHARRLFALEEGGNIYTRIQNPTTDVLESRVAALDGGIGGMAAASGHSAITMAILNIARNGDEIVSAQSIYGGAVNLLSKTLGQLGIKTHFVDAHDPEAFRRATNDRTRAYFIETMGNPLGDVPDIKAIADIAHENGIPLIADNTEGTPYLIRPIEHGADIVVYSSTKFLAGNGTVLGGIIVDSGKFRWKDNPRFPDFNQPDLSYHGIVYADACGDAAYITKLRTHILRDIGASISPFNAWVTLLGIETLGLRMKRHCENGLAVARFLESHPLVESVSYPALPSSPYHEVAKKYFPNGQSPVYCFDIKGSREVAAKFCDSLELISIVANLGDSRTILNCPSVTTHSQLSDDQLASIGLKPGTIRLSVGLEDPDDIIADLSAALEKCTK